MERERLLPLEEVVDAAREARANGASRFCMGAAWRNPTDRNLEHVVRMVEEVKALGLETCATLGMLREGQAEQHPLVFQLPAVNTSHGHEACRYSEIICPAL